MDAEDGAILGLAHACFPSRSSGRKQTRRDRPIEEKESLRQLEGARQAALVCSAARGGTVVADRESDIYEAFARRPAGVDLLVRAARDRVLDDGGRLFATVDALDEAGRTELMVPARPGRPARKAVLAARFTRAMLGRPKCGCRSDGDPGGIAIYLVDLREVVAPSGQKPPRWRLLTSAKVETLVAALTTADPYRRRWAIEQLFRTMKTQGFDIEGIRIGDSAPRNKLITAALIAAVAVRQLVHARDGGQPPSRPMTGRSFKPSAESWKGKPPGKRTPIRKRA